MKENETTELFEYLGLEIEDYPQYISVINIITSFLFINGHMEVDNNDI